MNLGTQYYRPPFPISRYWDDDFARMRDAGLNTVQFWVIWGWVEPTPGQFCFEDYDQLVELAGKHGLQVVLSTIAEVQPLWIHDVVPGSEMITYGGRTVVSTARDECHFGLTPGGCTDHPGVWGRMERFFEQVVTRYRGAGHLHGWDAWNELRWNVNAESLVCYCEHTLQAFRGWLDQQYGGLDGLNSAWLRRYSDWKYVQPGRRHSQPYTEIMAFEHFLTERANQHALKRYDLIKSLDPNHPVTLHGGAPSIEYVGHGMDHALNRGNDWVFAEHYDGIGSSAFPVWFNISDVDFATRMACTASAARASGKRVWLSEIQGGRASSGFVDHKPAGAAAQQHWLWNAIAAGADTTIFWCWRDEVFGRESGGYGFTGGDGRADERTAAMRHMAKAIDDHRDLFADYEPDAADVGILFSPANHYLHWAQEGTAGLAFAAFMGCGRALGRQCIAFDVIESEHLDWLDRLKVLFLPRVLVVDDDLAERLSDWVRAGGTLVCESECGAFDSRGIWRYPADRFTAELTGVAEIGRRNLPGTTVPIVIDGQTSELGIAQWLTPFTPTLVSANVLAECADGSLVIDVPAGRGRVICCGSYLAQAYHAKRNAGFESLVASVVSRAGCIPSAHVLAPKAEADSSVLVKTGRSGSKAVAFVFYPPDVAQAHLQFRAGLFGGPTLTDLMTGKSIDLQPAKDGLRCRVTPSSEHVAILTER